MTESTRKNVMLGTAGHVDHGKTALVKMLTGCDTDRLAEEKRRGLTIELGFAPCRMPDERIVGIVDVPGHVGFIKNMVAGAHGVDVVILVVAADDGVMPQTREHLDILTLMGVRHGLVAVTKIDLVDAEMRELVFEDVRRFTAGTFLEGKAVRGVSSITGEGFDAFLGALHAAVEEVKPPAGDEGVFRLWIEREFGIHGFGAVVSGIPTSGQVRVGDKLRVLPGEATARVRRLEVYGQDAEVGRAGECVAVNLTDIKAEELRRGQVLCPAASCEAFPPVAIFEAELQLLPAAARGMADYAEVHLHVGTAETMANVAMLEGNDLSPGRRAMVQLRCREELPVALRERFVVRSIGAEGRLTTLGGGRVLDLSNTRLRRKRPWILQRLTALAAAADDNGSWVAEHLRQSGRCLRLGEIAAVVQLPEPVTEAALETLQRTGDVLQPIEGLFLSFQTRQAVAQRIVQALEAYHAEHPTRLGAPAEDLANQLDVDPATFAAAVEHLVVSGKVERRGPLLALLSAAVKVSQEDRRIRDAVERLLREAKFQPPSSAELAEKSGASVSAVDKAMQLLCDEGLAVRIDPKLVLHIDAVAEAKSVVLDLFRRQRAFETTEFRDALGVSRKFAVPLVDYLDKARWTVRQGNRRTPGREAKAKLDSETA